MPIQTPDYADRRLTALCQHQGLDMPPEVVRDEEMAWKAAFVELSEDAILGTTLDGLIVSWNKGAERLYGYDAATMLGQHASTLATPDQPSPVPAAVTRLKRGETVEPTEVLRRRRDGSEFHAALFFSPIHDALGQMIGLSCIARDVTERKQTDAALLLASEARFRTAMDTMEEGLVLQDTDGSILFCNESAERILGLTADQMMGRTSQDPRWRAIREDGTDFPGEQHPAMVALREAAPQRNVVMGVDKPGGERTWVNINAVPLLHPSQGVVVTFSDITERRQAEETLHQNAEQLRRSEAGLRAVLESAPIILYAADADGTVTLSEGTGLTALGLKPGEAVGHSLAEFSGGDPQIEENNRRALAGESLSYDARVSGLCLHTELRPVRDGGGAVTGLIGVCFDVTARVASEERFRVLFEESSDAHLLCGQDGIVDCNDATLSLLRCQDKAQVLSLHPAVFSPEFQPDGRHSQEKGLAMEAVARERGSHRFEWTHRKMDGEEFPVEVTLTPVTLASGPVMLAVLHDLTERKRAEELVKDHAVVLEFQKQQLEQVNNELATLATTDGLTGLINHRVFHERLAEEVIRAVRYNTPLSIVLLDVDHFKRFNDSCGHPAGDDLLKQIARILQEGVRDTDLAARYGGEEFVILLPETDGEGATAFAERLRVAVEQQPWPLRAITASFGVAALLPGEDSTGIIARADTALYLSKREGRNCVTCDGAADSAVMERQRQLLAM